MLIKPVIRRARQAIPHRIIETTGIGGGVRAHVGQRRQRLGHKAGDAGAELARQAQAAERSALAEIATNLL